MSVEEEGVLHQFEQRGFVGCFVLFCWFEVVHYLFVLEVRCCNPRLEFITELEKEYLLQSIPKNSQHPLRI